ncbi:MAG: hypothetical protein ACYTBJ_17895 [Planctomycetota bacterium]|jgi:hypothetical protein
MSERRFVESIQRSVKMLHPKAFVWKVSDRFSMGIPDLFIVIDGRLYCIEAKAADIAGTITTVKKVKPENAPCLKHPFSGVQVSVMRQIKKAGAFVCGAIQISKDTAYIADPDKIPPGSNFTHKQLDNECAKVTKQDSLWRITEWPSLL